MKELFGIMEEHILNLSEELLISSTGFFFIITLLNIIQHFIFHETIICDNRDLPWRNREIKKLLVEKNLEFKSYHCSNKNMFLLGKFKALQCHMNICIEEQNEMHYIKLSSRLADPLTSPKTYCSKTNRFLAHILFFMKTNSSQTSKKKKAELFNHFFNYKIMLSFEQQQRLNYRSTSTHKQMP